MRRSKRMQPVRQLKKQHEQDQAKRLAEAQQALQQEQSQLQTLQDYQQDYFVTLQACQQGNQPISALQLDKYQQFLLRLKKAIENQQQVVVLKEQAVAAVRLQWAQANASLKALDSLIEKMRMEEDKLADKREQKMIDDLPKRIPGRDA